ncbi:MAG: hypothetical protein AVDCRST_MAG22-1332, partial [uncultured Rubrobacteraceae bacterium]
WVARCRGARSIGSSPALACSVMVSCSSPPSAGRRAGSPSPPRSIAR